ncbi:hypothetical protein PoB_000124300 [Plakobranchus ocellatus]|uniref:Uncharacterized protein n=1 Tax=Plakobranchus ocellatus TaxID=259542 RepID=A0AAV3XXL3_9GAST|nr:hypothetical protein PoB_000124300 [Plakobranchus ocellatus]
MGHKFESHHTKSYVWIQAAPKLAPSEILDPSVAKTSLSRVRAPLTRPSPDGGSENLTSPCFELATTFCCKDD